MKARCFPGPKTSRMAPSADLQKQEALLLPVVGSCPLFQMCLRPCKAVPGSWEQTWTQLSAPQTLQSDVLNRRLRIISTSLIQTAASMSDLFCQLSWSMQSLRIGNMDTTLQLGPGFQNTLVSNTLEMKKEKKPKASLVTVLQQYWME